MEIKKHTPEEAVALSVRKCGELEYSSYSKLILNKLRKELGAQGRRYLQSIGNF